MNAIDIDVVIRACTRGDYHWFDPDTLAWFSSRVAPLAYLDASGEHAYFVTSEQDKSYPYPAWDGKRRWSVRRCDLAQGRIATVGEFGAYPDGKAADHAARSAAG